MADRPENNAEEESKTPLFQNMDEREQLYAPQQLPSGADVDEGVDAGQTGVMIVPPLGTSAGSLTDYPGGWSTTLPPPGSARPDIETQDDPHAPDNEP